MHLPLRIIAAQRRSERYDNASRDISFAELFAWMVAERWCTRTFVSLRSADFQARNAFECDESRHVSDTRSHVARQFLASCKARSAPGPSARNRRDNTRRGIRPSVFDHCYAIGQLIQQLPSYNVTKWNRGMIRVGHDTGT